MATKRIFTINGSNISNMIKGLFANISSSRFVATSKSGSNIANLPLLIVILAVVFFPVLLIAGVILSLIFGINISVERDITKDTKIIDIK